MQKKLDEFAVGQHGVILSVAGDGRIRRRLFDMGVTPGAEVMLRKKAPLGDPIEVTMRGYELTLRKTEAAAVVCECSEKEERKLLEAKEEKRFLLFNRFKKKDTERRSEV